MVFANQTDSNGTIDKRKKCLAGNCLFPFKHKGIIYRKEDGCIETNEKKYKGKICATKRSKYGILTNYGWCKDEVSIIREFNSEMDIQLTDMYMKNLKDSLLSMYYSYGLEELGKIEDILYTCCTKLISNDRKRFFNIYVTPELYITHSGSYKNFNSNNLKCRDEYNKEHGSGYSVFKYTNFMLHELLKKLNLLV